MDGKDDETEEESDTVTTSNLRCHFTRASNSGEGPRHSAKALISKHTTLITHFDPRTQPTRGSEDEREGRRKGRKVEQWVLLLWTKREREKRENETHVIFFSK